ncbi:MAG: transglycosylase SLT domain-containing protein [Alphaproteobacteria bacterium]|jgi:hypothetical protein|nr:transglycosylase SLT domain-containing protein [Alphaproteobacteria bacterium]
MGAFGLLAMLLAWPMMSRAQAALCDQAAQAAARTHGVPLDMLRMVALLETGRKQGGALRPWPWALNAGGTSHWLPDKRAAKAKARDILATGRRNLDFGCFQLNYHWHGAQFSGIDAMLDPGLNADYAARYLLSQYRRLGDWKAAIGAYHSRTPEHAQRYLARYDSIKRQLTPLAETAPAPSAPGPSRPRNRFALLTGGGGGARGSLVPSSVLAQSRPLIAMTGGN